jgi:cell division cycle 2-like protein
MSSRWADEEADKALKQREKEEKARKKLLKQQKAEQEAAARRKAEAEQVQNDDKRPTKRQRTAPTEDPIDDGPSPLFRFPAPTWGACRSVNEYEALNAIEEGSYGWVSRARNRTTNSIVALKHLKLDNLHEGFPITALREIQALKSSHHKHIVSLHEVVVGDGNPTDVYLVMDFIEHDLKTLQENMTHPFAISEVKTLMLQLTSAVDYLHTNWILHRDLKTSNILLNNRGEIKVADFGMARQFGDPMPPHMTQLVVTLWYRAPELLLGAETYDQSIDIWSLGCIMGELLQNSPILPGKNEIDELAQIFTLCGLPTEKSWKHFRSLPNARGLKLPQKKEGSASKIKTTFPDLSKSGVRLLEDLLALNPNRRPDAGEVLEHPWFGEDPRPKSEAMFPTFPSKAGQERRRRQPTPQAPRGGEAPKLDAMDFSGVFG